VRKANISFDDLQRHLSRGIGTSCEGIFTSIAPNLFRGFEVKFDNLQLWLVIKVC